MKQIKDSIKNKIKIDNKILTLIQLSLIIVVLSYFIITFVELKFNPTEWHVISRIIFIVISGAGVTFITKNLYNDND